MIQIMGILNVTPDSFSDGGRYLNIDLAIAHAVEMMHEGASLIDIGGESTRPNAQKTTVEEESERVLPILKNLGPKLLIPISIDTRKPSIAYEACKLGATIINDVSAGEDPEMFDVAKLTRSEIILMHGFNKRAVSSCHPEAIAIHSRHPEKRSDEGSLRDSSPTAQNDAYYSDRLAQSDVFAQSDVMAQEDVNFVQSVKEFLLGRAEKAQSVGIEREKILLDPGIGFSKSSDEDFAIIRCLREFTSLPYRIVLGASRKRFMRALGESDGYALVPNPDQKKRVDRRLGGSIAVALEGAASGVSIVRVHDVQTTAHALKIAERIKGTT